MQHDPAVKVGGHMRNLTLSSRGLCILRDFWFR
jgi:hypothetical protein